MLFLEVLGKNPCTPLTICGKVALGVPWLVATLLQYVPPSLHGLSSVCLLLRVSCKDARCWI